MLFEPFGRSDRGVLGFLLCVAVLGRVEQIRPVSGRAMSGHGVRGVDFTRR